MLGTLALLVSVATGDPRPSLLELRMAGRAREALARVQEEIADRPAASHQLGLDYLRAYLLEQLGRQSDAEEAFASAIGTTPRLALYSRYRLALEQEQLGHPEVAAGLTAGVTAAEPASPLAPAAVRVLVRTLAKGGDCRLLRRIHPRQLPTLERRQLLLAQADCALRGGSFATAHELLVSLLQENHEDDPSRGAASRLAPLVPESERGKVVLLLAQTFFEHRELDSALRLLERLVSPGAGGKSRALSLHDLAEARYTLGRAHFALGHYEPAAAVFGEVSEKAPTASERARALFQQGRSFEMQGHGARATTVYRLAFLAEPDGEWASPALLATLRLEWRTGNEAPAVSLFEILGSRPAWRESARRAALFLASSDLVRGRRDRARGWLDRAAASAREDEVVEVAYWRGRLAELEQNAAAAVASYLEVLRPDPDHPLAQSAVSRLGIEPLAHAAAALGHKLAGSRRAADLYGAWLLLGDADPAGRSADRRLRQQLEADRSTAAFLHMGEVPVDHWPLWTASLRRPEEVLLALGAWPEAAPAVREHFPLSDPSLAFTGCLLLARNGETGRSVQLAEAIRERVPSKLPFLYLPRPFHQVLDPLAYREPLFAEGRLRGVSPHLLAAILRVESRFNPQELSPTGARGLAQLTPAAANQVAARIGMQHLDLDDIYLPDVAIDLAGARLAALLRIFGGVPQLTVAAYSAGEATTRLWRTYCFSSDPDEFFTKVGSRDTRAYLERVLSTWGRYRRLYS